MARTYGLLPSQVLRQADTFDLMVMDVSIAHAEMEQAIREGKPIPDRLLQQDELVERFKEVTGRDVKISDKQKTSR
tara:strand:+ start:2736 stop:2963 length:228 start_codon:yes stop_codon:yes gene_type:complete